MAYKRHGRYATSDPAFGTAAAGTAVATVFDPFPENGWVVDLIAHLGKDVAIVGTPTVEIDLYDTASNAPDDLTARSARFTPAAGMDSGSSGDVYTRSVNWTGGGTGSPLATAMKARSGVRFAGSLNVQGSGGIAFGFSVGGADLFRDLGVASTPPSVFQIDQTQSGEGVITISVGYWQNTKPTATYTGPTGPINTAAPTISGSFADAETPYGDRMTLYQIQVRNKANNVLLWEPDPFTADAAQKAAGTFSEVYAGDTITPGMTVQVSIRVADEFGSWSNWTNFGSAEMTYSQGGRVIATGPTTKQLTVTGVTFAGNYRHALLLAATAIKVRLRSATGALIYESGEITKAISAPATSTTDVPFTLAQSLLSPSFTLSWGTQYLLDIQAKDSSGAWSGYYSAGAVTFTTNARPTIPSGLSPGNNSIITTLQQITFIGSDPDDASALLTPELRIAGPQPVTNGALASNVTGWTIGSATGVTRTFAYDGAQGSAALGSGKIAITVSTAALGTTMALRNDTKVPAIVGETYTGRIAVRTDNANLTPRAMITWYTAGDVAIGSDVLEADWTPTINTWSARFLTAVAPPTAAYFKVGIVVYWDTANQIGNVWVDDASVDPARRYVRTPTWNSGVGRWEYTPTSTDMPAFGAYVIDARLGDGTLFSNWSPAVGITYADGAAFHFVRPTDEATVATTRTRMTWALDSGDQAQYKMEIRTASAGHGSVAPVAGYDAYIWDSGWIVSTTDRDYQIPDGIGGINIVDNENWYQARLHIKNALGIESTQTVDFYVQFPPVRELQLSATLVPARFDDPNRPTQVLLTWPQTDYPSSQFEEYRITKRLASQTPGQAITIFRSSSPVDTRLLDDNVRSGNTEYVYALTQLVTRDGNASRSERSEASVTVNFKEIVINDAVFSGDFRVVARNFADYAVSKSKVGTAKVPIGQRKPVIVFGGSNYDTVTVTLFFVDDEYATGAEYKAALDELHDRGGLTDDGVPTGVLMIRHPRGDYLFFNITQLDWTYPPGMYVANLTGIQNSYVEGGIL